MTIVSVSLGVTPVQAQPMYYYAVAPEGSNLIVEAPLGAVFTDVYYASYGNSENFVKGFCDSSNSFEIVYNAVVGKSYAELGANNNVFGDPCGGTYKNLSVILVYESATPQLFLNSPTNVTAYVVKDSVRLSWDAPADNGVVVERYAVMWTAEGYNGWAISSTDTSIDISLDVLKSTLPLNTTFMFSIRADNDTLGVYSQSSEYFNLYVEEPQTPVFLCWDGSTVLDLLLCPVEPTPTPTPTPTKTESPTPTVEPTPTVTVVPTPEPTTPSPTPSPTQTREPEVVPEEPTNIEELLTQYSISESIPAEELLALGIDYSQLPPEQPITLENGVVITAQVADAIEIFESPSEIFSAVFTDPSKALTAVANIGADLSKEVRKKAQLAAVPAVIVTQVIAGTASLLTRRI